MVRESEEGGQLVTEQIVARAIDYVVENSTTTSRTPFKVLVRVFANVRGLRRDCDEKSEKPDNGGLSAFIDGFNKDVHCDFIDVGGELDLAAEKVKGTLSLLSDEETPILTSYRSELRALPRERTLQEDHRRWCQR